MELKRIVMTGGPCGGKSEAVARVREHFAAQGWTVYAIAETATELISGGVSPDSCSSNVAYQRLQMKLQMDKEYIFWQAAYSMEDQKVLMLYDRGVLDNWAYMDKREIKKVLQLSGETEDSLRNRYDAVFHLETLAKWSAEEYNKRKGNNIARTADAEKAIELDNKVIDAWKKHKYFRTIANTEEREQKGNALIKEISVFLEQCE